VVIGGSKTGINKDEEEDFLHFNINSISLFLSSSNEMLQKRGSNLANRGLNRITKKKKRSNFKPVKNRR
jgi:hypothetical protein